MSSDDQPIEFPDLNQGLLDEATLAQYFEDLRLARVFAVLVKGGAERYANENSIALETAQKLLAMGLCRGVQIRYVWQDEEWWDTLMRTAEGTRLVRVHHRFPEEP